MKIRYDVTYDDVVALILELNASMVSVTFLKLASNLPSFCLIRILICLCHLFVSIHTILK